MKILTRKQFMKEPEGTLFSYYKPCYFEGLHAKDTGYEKDNPDFSMSDFIGAVKSDSSNDLFEKCDRMELGESFPVDFEFSGREGLFDEELLYAVYDKEDVRKLIARLQAMLTLQGEK